VNRALAGDANTAEPHARVIVIGPSPPPFNGMSIATHLVLDGLREKFEIYHLDTADRRGLTNIGKVDFTNVYLAFRHGWTYLRALITFRPRLIYVPISQSALPFVRDCLFLVPARLLGKRVVVHLHGSDFRHFYTAQPWWFRWLVRFALGESRKAIVLGGALSGMFQGVLPAEAVSVVSNGIPDFAADSNSSAMGCEPQTVLFISTLMREKGVLDLINSIPLVVKRFRDCRFVFAGEWLRAAEEREAKSVIAAHDLENHVRFMGPVGPAVKQQLLKAASVFVLPSYHEGQPFAILEALCAGLPVIATDVGCVAESVIDGRNGFIVRQGEPESIADRIMILLSDPVRQKRMGAASRDVYLSQHKAEVFLSGLSSVWTEALA
jgi:glycosyltransferase involved in cell wall biosynthesis